MGEQSTPAQTDPGPSKRVLVVDDDPAVLESVRASLQERGFTVETLNDLRFLTRKLREVRPRLMILDELVPPWSGREALRVLGPQAVGAVAVVALVEDGSAINELNWFRSGALDVLRKPLGPGLGERIEALLEAPPPTIRDAFLLSMARDRRSATLVVHPDTPFEGRATFLEGRLGSAAFGPLLGAPAVDEMLRFEDAHFRWEGPGEKPPPEPLSARPPDAPKPRVLVVEDEEALRTLTSRQLEAAGYAVDTAENGQRGLQQARSRPYDVIVADLAMPVLDGWGMLRRLQEDVAGRESAVLVLSAHDEFREALKAARSGARAYLKKTGRAKYLLDAVHLLTTPRREICRELWLNRPFRVDTRVVGVMWLLTAIAESDAAGRLELSDPLGKYVIEIAEGSVVSALVVRGNHIAEGQAALTALIAARPEGTWSPAQLTARDGAPWLFDAIEASRRKLAEATFAQLEELVVRIDRLRVQPELASLFARVATARELEVLGALREEQESLEALAQKLKLTLGEVRESVVELLRRGVIGLPAADEAPDDGARAEAQ